MYKKVIKLTKHVHNQSSYAFEEELRKYIDNFQNKGLQVDIANGGTEKSFSAIITAYELVPIVPTN